MTGVKTAYTTKDLAKLLCVTDRAVQIRARRESWLSRPRPGRGGGHEWLLSSMPEVTRQAIAKALTAQYAKEADEQRRKQPVNTLTRLPASRRGRAEARAMAAQLARRFALSLNMPYSSGMELFVIQYNRGEIEVPDWVRAALPHLCRSSLINWEKTAISEGIESLAGKQGLHRIGTGVMAQPYVLNYCLAHIYRNPHQGPSQIHKSLSARLTLEDRPERLPKLRRVQAWYQEWREKNAEMFMFISNPDQWRSHFRVAFGDAAGLVNRLNQEWEMDSTPCDLILSDGRRHTIVACIDLYSRRVMFHVSRTSSSHAVATCLRKAIMAFGVPEIVRTDNGQDYVSKHIERVLLDLNIPHDTCDPFSPEQKPFVERVFGTFLRDNLEGLTGYTGHNVSQRKDIEARESFARRMMARKDRQTVNLNLSPEELQAFCDRWANDSYMHRKHGKLGCTPYEQALAYDGAVNRIDDAEALRLLMLPCVEGGGTRKVSKDGGIHIFGDKYIHSRLGLHVNRRVQVRVDDEERGLVHIYTLDGKQFICAARGIQNSGMTGREVRGIAVNARRQQAENLRGSKAAMAASAKKMKVENAPYERLKADELRARKIEAEQPLRPEMLGPHTTPALTGAAEAARQPDYRPTPMTEQERESHKRLQAVVVKAQEEANAKPARETAQDRYHRHQSLKDRADRGERLAPEDLRWMSYYERTPEYDAHVRLQKHYGDLLVAKAG